MTEIQQRSVSFDIDDRRISVTVDHGAGASTAVVQRIGDVEVQKHIPIGTRRAAHLTMQVDGTAARLEPGPGRWARRSFTVTAIHGGTTYRLRPKSPDVSRLTRGGVHLGDFQTAQDGRITVTWQPDVQVSSADAAVGYLLAAAFGTGAQLFFAMLFGLAEGLPG